jgi:hypothetical protein
VSPGRRATGWHFLTVVVGVSRHFAPASELRSPPVPTAHARERFAERAACPAVDLSEAWQRAVWIGDAEILSRDDVEGVRYWPPGRAATIARDGSLQTVIRVAPSAMPSLQAAVRRCPAPTPAALGGERA